MQIAVMQPYIFPYLGYYQLINIVDKFVIYDSVNFINKGWINRNYISVNKKKFLFTIPLINASQNTIIKDLKLSNDIKWKNKFLKTLKNNYSKSNYFEDVYNMIDKILLNKSRFLIDLHFESLKIISNYLGIDAKFDFSSKIETTNLLKGQHRILHICKRLNANRYVNPISGKALYSSKKFTLNKIDLRFHEFLPQSMNNDFNLSIIHMMMNFSRYDLTKMLNNYRIIKDDN